MAQALGDQMQIGLAIAQRFQGLHGPNRDYVLETVQALEALGYRETDLHLIAERLRHVSVISSQ